MASYILASLDMEKFSLELKHYSKIRNLSKLTYMRGLDLPYKNNDMIFHDIKSKREIEVLIFVRNLSNIAIGEIGWVMTGTKKIENFDAEKEHM